MPYLCFAFVFVPYLREVVENNDVEAMQQICDFLEEMAISKDKKVSNLMAVGVLEDILPERSLIEILKKYLKVETKKWLVHLEKAYGWETESAENI